MTKAIDIGDWVAFPHVCVGEDMIDEGRVISIGKAGVWVAITGLQYGMIITEPHFLRHDEVRPAEDDQEQK